MDSLPDTSDENDGTRAEPAASGMLTETLARLYWRQGLHATALDIYCRLAQAQPTNQRLREQIARLEHHIAAGALDTRPEQVPEACAPALSDSERVRRARTDRVIVHLERWLHHLRCQRGLRA